ncbi:type VI secretion system baseplate subunit TssG [Flexibacterium corallicola]|uniref:type VI secretion system baseplate subunit TssG n=1 Tax=Flexibacterium corallicola TaxID=3037259 RepID=UPI00286FA8CB|nr:type VI secretion system baseplate subunit TssG [Pseudovibrio sp. M1P-2-3]
MASQNRTTAPYLREKIQEDARDWSFFQAVEHLQRQHDDGREVGTHLLPEEEKVLFAVNHGLGFPISDVFSAQPFLASEDELKEALPLLIEVGFLGLHGTSSPLPSYYQEVIAQYDQKGSLIKGFFDFFHNRVLGLLHRVMRKYRYYIQYKPEAQDRFSHQMFAIFGMGDEDARNSSAINWERMLTHADALASRNRSPSVIVSVVAHAFFHQSVEVEEWVQRKVDIPEDQRSSLGQSNMVLGENAIAGERVPDISSKFNIYLKNLKFNRFKDFLPHGRDYKPLRDLIDFMLRDQHAYDIKLGLAEGEAIPVTLNKDCESRLGWSSFLGGSEAEARDVLITARL